MKQYLNATRLLTYGEDGFLPRLFSIENDLIESAGKQLEAWYQRKPDQQVVADYVNQMARKAYTSLKESFTDILD